MVTEAQAISALLYNPMWRWNADSSLGTSVTITYSFMTKAPAGANGFTAMSAAEQQATRAALAEWSKIANVTFKEVASGGQIAFGEANLGTGGVTGNTSWSGTSGKMGGWKTTHADVLINNGVSLDYSKGGFGMETLVHEIGHALGLKHTFDTSGPTLSGVENTHQYSVMAYNNAPYQPNIQPHAPQVYDIAAVQKLYGANTTTNAGDTTYQFSNTSTDIQCIWDGGGKDILSAENQTLAATIDLNEGHFSSIGNYKGAPAHDNISIALHSIIEAAVGGSGADTLIASSHGSALAGLGGADKLVAGAGSDSFYYSSSSQGGDTISGFVSGSDHFWFKAAAFGLSVGTLSAANFVTVNTAYNGSNGSGTNWSQHKATFIEDSNHNLYFAAQGQGSNYVKIANLGSVMMIKATDIRMVDNFAAGISTMAASAAANKTATATTSSPTTTTSSKSIAANHIDLAASDDHQPTFVSTETVHQTSWQDHLKIHLAAHDNHLA